MGSATPAAFFSALRAYNTRAISARIAQDCFIMTGSRDQFVPLDRFYTQLRLLTGARSVTGRLFTVGEHAQSHSQVGNLGLTVTEMLGWIETHVSE